MKANTDLTGRVAVITGAARGIGLALALHAADKGMRLALADRDEDALIAAVEQVRAKDVAAIAIHGDMFVCDAVRELARRSAAELGPPWLVCNNPGVSIQMNVWGVIHGVQSSTSPPRNCSAPAGQRPTWRPRTRSWVCPRISIASWIQWGHRSE